MTAITATQPELAARSRGSRRYATSGEPAVSSDEIPVELNAQRGSLTAASRMSNSCKTSRSFETEGCKELIVKLGGNCTKARELALASSGDADDMAPSILRVSLPTN